MTDGCDCATANAVMPRTACSASVTGNQVVPAFSVFQTLLYLRLRRLIPFAIAHALMDGASVVSGVLAPYLSAPSGF